MINTSQKIPAQCVASSRTFRRNIERASIIDAEGAGGRIGVSGGRGRRCAHHVGL